MIKTVELPVFFSQGRQVCGINGKIYGMGLFESELVALGIEKRELKRLTNLGVIHKVTTVHKNSWRNTYVLPFKTKDESDASIQEDKEKLPSQSTSQTSV